MRPEQPKPIQSPELLNATELILWSDRLETRTLSQGPRCRAGGAAGSPQRVDQVEFRQLVQVEDSRGEARDQDVRWFVEGSSGQVVKVAIFVEKVSETVNMGQAVTSHCC